MLFDNAPLDKLMIKIRPLKIVNEVANWIEGWLSDRKQRVVIYREASKWFEVTSGVPLSSALGSLLFIIYINDNDRDLTSNLSKSVDDNELEIMLQIML